MKNTFKFGSIIFSIMLIMLIINISFAWYAAKVNQGNIENLLSEGISITLDDTYHELTPDILKEGVLTTVGSEYVLPDDYETNKENYIEVAGSSLEIVEAVELYLDGIKSVNLEFIVTYNDGEEVNVTEYFDISYFLVISGGAKGQMLTTTDNTNSKVATTEAISTVVDGVQTNNLYDLYVNISYNTPNELLPHDFITSGVITLTVRGSI